MVRLFVFIATSADVEMTPAEYASNEFTRQKDFSNMCEAAFSFRSRNTNKNRGCDCASVTTTHLFWPNQRRSVALLLRFWLPNSANCSCRGGNRATPGRGGQYRRVSTEPRPKSAQRIFGVIDPPPYSVASKNVGPCGCLDDPGAGAQHISNELRTHH